MDRSPLPERSLDFARRAEDCVIALTLAQNGLGGLSCYDQNLRWSVRFAVSLFCPAALSSRSSVRSQRPRMNAERFGFRNAASVSRARPRRLPMRLRLCSARLPAKQHQATWPMDAIAPACPAWVSQIPMHSRPRHAKGRAMHRALSGLRQCARFTARQTHRSFTARPAIVWAAVSKAQPDQVRS